MIPINIIKTKYVLANGMFVVMKRNYLNKIKIQTF